MQRYSLASLCLSGLVLAALGGCSGKERIGPPSLSAGGAASQAMELYDADGDGKLSGAELDKASGIKAAINQVDKDGDGAVSEDEIEDRINEWKSSKIGLTSFRCKVKLDGRPLIGAKITYEPEPIFDGALKPGFGTTDGNGIANPTLPEADRPNPLFEGMPVGFYKVKVSLEANGKETVPAKYNTETILGQEVGPNAEGMGNVYIDIDLKS